MDVHIEAEMHGHGELMPPFSLPTLPVTGHWLRGGAPAEVLTICANGAFDMQAGVMITTSGPVIFKGGARHGIGTLYAYPEEPCYLSVTFHWNSEMESVVPHHLKEVYPGVFVTPGNDTMFLVPARFSGNQIPSKVYIPPDVMPELVRHHFEQYGPSIKHRMLWLHPTRPPQWLLLLSNQQVFWCNQNGTVCTPGPTGQYAYLNEEGLLDLWFIRFHWLGNEEKAEACVLARVLQPGVPAAHIWRFVEMDTLGLVSKEILERALAAPVGKLEKYHIVMLEIGV